MTTIRAWAGQHRVPFLILSYAMWTRKIVLDWRYTR